MQGQAEVMCIPLMHHLKNEVGTVKNVSPCVDHMTLTFSNGLIEVEPIEVESHGADAEGGKQDAHWPSCGKKCSDRELLKMHIGRSVVEVAVCGNDVVCLFFLTKLISIVLADLFSRLTDK